MSELAQKILPDVLDKKTKVLNFVCEVVQLVCNKLQLLRLSLIQPCMLFR